MEFGLSKSQVVVFSATRDRVVIPDVYLGDQVLVQASGYLYLGVYLHWNLSWRQHCENVLQDATRSSNLICSMISDSAPPARVVRALVLAVVRAQLSYAIALWCPPTKQLWAQFQSALIKPLRFALGVPGSAHGLAVLAECGIPSMPRFRDLQMLLFARRVMLLPDDHPSRAVYLSQLAVKKPGAKSRFPLAKRVVQLRKEWLIQTLKTEPREKLADRAQKLSFYDLSFGKGSRMLKSIKKRPGTSAYVMSDSRVVGALRARLRLDRSLLNESMSRRGATNVQATCPHCPLQIEDVDHVILHCPAYHVARARCFDTLRHHGFATSIASVLGELPSAISHGLLAGLVSANAKEAALEAGARFLVEIHKIRPF